MASTSTSCAGQGIMARPILITSGPVTVSIPVAIKGDEWIVAETLRDEFATKRDTQDAIDTTVELENENEASVELFARFLRFVATKVEDGSQSTAAHVAFLHDALKHFTTTYLSEQDIHTVSAAFDLDVRKTVLSAYYLALATLEKKGVSVPRAPAPALLKAAGTNEVYFDELQTLYDTYKPYVAPFVAALTEETLLPLAAAEEATNFYSDGLDVVSWLTGASPRPPVAYLASIPISLVLIALTQLVQYLVVCRASNLTPEELRSRFAGATGHSQGIISAVAIAASTTYESFFENTKKALTWAFHLAKRGQLSFPVLALEPSIIQDAIEGGEGTPTPMLSVTGLSLKELEGHIKKTNAHLPSNSQLQISLYNGLRAFVVTGPARALYGLVTSLRKVKAPSGLDQGRTPFSQRKPVFSVRFLVINVPFHSPYLTGVTDTLFEEDLGGKELWTQQELGIPVYHTEDGSDLRAHSGSLTRALCDQIFTMPIHWAKATGFPESATHAVDFGPGGLSGIGPLTARNLDGRGVRVIVIGDKAKGAAEFFDAQNIKREDWWSKKYAPKLVKTSDGTLHIDTPFSRLLGKPPLMVAGMTPSTVQAGFVSAVLNAGFHIELAGGGQFAPFVLRDRVAELRKKIPPGVGLTLNSIYINPMQFGFQVPLWQELRRTGVPIEGFCVAAGVPSTEKATEIIEGMRSTGIKHISFKPGSVEGIRQVLNIAAAHSDFPIIMQWTGGRAGGHHSCEDFHQPIIATYSSIRQQRNVILVGGSGFGGSDDIWPYLTGDWSIEYGLQPMPFDGFLFASRVMVAKEAHTSPAVKDLIVAAKGVEDSQWEGTYAKETGGILTVRSELGEPIHKIATRAVRLWKEFDDTVFKLPKEKREAWLNERRGDVIAKLNKDFSKPWFGWKKDGSVVEDLADMTYEEVVLRLVRLMYVAHQERWVDLTLRNLTGDWLRRVEERFAGVNGGSKASIIQSYKLLDKPEPFIKQFFETYPLATEQLLATEDKAYFLAICQRTTQKPVPFIPILDATFELWFKKDSLWAAEDIDAIFDQDPQRVCILQGPVAVRHSKVKDEPIKDLLGNVVSALAKKLLERTYNGDSTKVPIVDYLGPKPVALPEDITSVLGVQRSMTEKEIVYQVGSKLPETPVWLETLAGPRLDWLRALLISPTIVQGTSYVDNPLRRLFAARRGQRVVINLEKGLPTAISLYGAARSHGEHKSQFKAVEAKFDASSHIINVTLFEDRHDVSVPLRLKYQYKPSMGYMPIHEIAHDRNRRIKEFYWKLWFGDNEVLPEIDVRATYTSPEVTIDSSAIERFCSIIGNQGELFKTARVADVQAPMDFAIVTGWQAIMKAIFPATIDGDLLKLVHLSNSFRMIDGAAALKVGDVCKAEARIISVANTDAGKAVKVKGIVSRGDEPVIEVISSFLYRGTFNDFDNTFELTDSPDYVVELPDEASVGVLKAKEWFDWADETKPLLPGTTLVFRVKSEATFRNKTCYKSVSVSGDIFVRDQIKRLVKVGSVDYLNEDSRGNPVVDYLERHGKPEGLMTPLPNDGYTMSTPPGLTVFTSPPTNEPYSKVSGDFNPIHVNPYFADFASLPGTITPWHVVERGYKALCRDRRCTRAYDVAFVGMILPGDELKTSIKHIGMRDGNIVVKVQTANQNGEKVLEGTAEVAQPTTVYVFTGQGSQEPGMGMELYNNSPAARSVWEAADAHLTAVYGFSIVEIVKDNPKEKTIHFGGIKGQAIRQRYMDMTYDTMDKDGNVKTLPLFGDINVRTQRYTFSHPSGLLFATQFAQIALVVTERAAFEDMRLKGFVQKDSAFAGHSLGEYSALASIAGVLPISSLVDVVFYRGITMQRAVERDSQNRSNYAMCAVNPGRVSKTFNDAALREVVDNIANRTGCLLEIVNFNVEGQQYVCAGELVALQALTNVLNYLKMEKIDIEKLTERFTVEQVKEMLDEIVDSSYKKAQELQEQEGYIKLERGFATIPLPGIDVPFHSRYLWAGVLPFRAYLSKKINPAHLNPDMLVGKYVPNLVAKPFQVTKDYAQLIYEQTLSPRLDKVLRKWDQDDWGSEEHRQKLAYIILVELLAYQFASPVRWIETQDILFSKYKFERFVEIGPSPTLTGMATRTLKANLLLVRGRAGGAFRRCR
ncbi:hypothetical protein NM688_g6254 [Phlebia brevispora]|uniref:Uncharacterized protein n=1 Tax=Phlebia brevispora TaxID=194682 RepID=A0ACC1SIH2_9APHY|nr:hypothetical protein NM688_g6254 [Phlebia brevispora]